MASPLVADMRKQPLVTILTPTYNDAEHLPLLVQSVMDQLYTNWEWIIVDDGSTDNTREIVETLSDPRIRIFSKENGDQLNALAYALPNVRGEVVAMIHSDDTFVSKESVRDAVERLLESGADGIYANYQTMDGSGNPTGELATPDVLDDGLALKTVLQMGTNFVGDPFFVRREVFDSHVVPNYIRQNTIYYFDYKGSNTLRLVKSTPWYRYRVFSQNYIHSNIGKFVALSGQFRTVSRLLNGGVSPGMNLAAGYTWFRVSRRFDLRTSVARRASNRSNARLFGFWARDLVRHGYPQLLISIARAVSHSYANATKQDKARVWQADQDLQSYGPADSRIFYRTYEQGGIPEVCLSLLNTDFDHIVVRDEFAKKQVSDWLNFFSLQYPVVVEAS